MLKENWVGTFYVNIFWTIMTIEIKDELKYSTNIVIILCVKWSIFLVVSLEHVVLIFEHARPL